MKILNKILGKKDAAKNEVDPVLQTILEEDTTKQENLSDVYSASDNHYGLDLNLDIACSTD